MAGTLEQTVENEAKKPNIARRFGRFLKRNIKKIGLVTGGVFLSGVIGASYISFKREGTPIRGELDGKIDAAYYHALAEENKPVEDLSKIADLVAEVYHLNTGKKIEDDFRFNLYKKKPLRIRVAEKCSGQEISGLNWGNGDLYIRDTPFLEILKIVFHEEGHGKTDSTLKHFDYLVNDSRRNTEPIAEKNVIDSMIALMYLDPDLGYVAYSNYLCSNVYHDSFLNENTNKWAAAILFNQLRCAKKGDLEIKEVYPDNETIKKAINESVKERKCNDLVDATHQGVLGMFKQRFGEKADFAEKYEKLQKYFTYGMTDNIYNKIFIPRETLLQRVKEKEEFLAQNHSEIIKRDIRSSLFADYRFLNDEEKIYAYFNQFFDKCVKEGKIEKIQTYNLISNIDYALKQGRNDKAKELFDLLKKINEEKKDARVKRRIESYEPYLR